MELDPRDRTLRRGVLGLALASFAALALPPRPARAAPVVRPWPPARATPPLALTDISGSAWDLAALKGRPVLLNFWATWCEPCRAEMPSLERLAAREKHTRLAILLVNYKEPLPTIRHFLEASPSSLPILLDADGEAASAWTPHVFPSSVLIDRQGTPRTTVIGELDWMGSAARELIMPLLAPQKAI